MDFMPKLVNNVFLVVFFKLLCLLISKAMAIQLSYFIRPLSTTLRLSLRHEVTALVMYICLFSHHILRQITLKTSNSTLRPLAQLFLPTPTKISLYQNTFQNEEGAQQRIRIFFLRIQDLSLTCSSSSVLLTGGSFITTVAADSWR